MIDNLHIEIMQNGIWDCYANVGNMPLNTVMEYCDCIGTYNRIRLVRDGRLMSEWFPAGSVDEFFSQRWPEEKPISWQKCGF